MANRCSDYSKSFCDEAELLRIRLDIYTGLYTEVKLIGISKSDFNLLFIFYSHLKDHMQNQMWVLYEWVEKNCGTGHLHKVYDCELTFQPPTYEELMQELPNPVIDPAFKQFRPDL